MKQVPLFVILFFLFISVAYAECDPGLDDVCDMECFDVDYDCDNGLADVQDYVCNPSQDGFCDTNCLDIDYDCLVETYEERIISSLSQTDEDEEQALIDEPFSYEEGISRTELILVSLGLVLLLIALIFFFSHLRDRVESKKYLPLLPYGQVALEKGYSISQIKQSLEHRGYSKDFIKGYLRALEPRP